MSRHADDAPSPRTAFTNRLRDYANVHPELSAGEVAQVVVGDLLDEDKAFIEAYFIHEGRAILTWDLRSDWIQTRRGIYQVVDISKNGEPSFEKMPEKKLESLYERITQWREYDPISKQGRLLIDFNKEMLLKSAEKDEETAVHHAWKSRFKQDLAKALPNDTTTIGEHLSPDFVLQVLSNAKQDIKKEIQRGNIRIKIKPMGEISRQIEVSRQVDGGNPTRPEVDRGLATV